MANEIDIVVKSTNNSKLDDLRADAKRTGDQVGSNLEKGFKEGEQASDRTRKQVKKDLDSTADEAKKTGSKAGRDFGGGFADALETVQGGPQGAVEATLGKIKGAGGVVAAGAAIGSVLLQGITGALEREDLGGRMAAQLGGTVRDAERFGRLAGEVYGDNFGDSMEDAAAGVVAVVRNKLADTRTATDAEIKKLSELALTTAKVTEQDANAVARAARQMLVNGLARSAEEAFDIIVRASQKGLDVNGDLIDTIVEYGTKFRDLGLDGKQALGLISQAMEAGARDTDFAADALKEFEIRAKDGSEATARGFRAVGLDAEDMGNAIARGGKFARAALEDTLEALRAIEDPIKRDQAAVDLFGTKAEDLGDALFAMDLDTVNDQLGDVAGAAEDAGKAMETSGETMSRAWKNVNSAMTDFGAHMVRGIENAHALAGLIGRGFGPEKTAGIPVATAFFDEFNDRIGSVTQSWLREADSIDKVTVTLEKNIDTHKEAMGVFLSAAEAEIRYQKSIDDAAESLKKNGKILDVNTEQGRENKQALLDIADAAYKQIAAMEQNGATAEAVTQSMATARDQFVDLARKMGLSKSAADQLADQLKLIPGDYRARVSMDASGFHQVGAGVFATLNELSRGVTVPIRTGRIGSGLGFAHGGIVGAEPPLLPRAGGGPGRANVRMHEQGEEIVDLPNGARVIPAGMSRAMFEGAMGGGGGPIDIRLIVGSGATGAVADLINYLIRMRQIDITAAVRS